MKMNQDEIAGRVGTCVGFLTRALDKNRLQNETRKFQDDFQDLSKIIVTMSMYLAEFNFYPSGLHTHCCQVAFFTSLTGQRWNLKDDERISFEEMFKRLIQHCQGSCAGKTTYAVILTDNWNDDIAAFWEPNIQQLKNNGVRIEVRMMVGGGTNSYYL